MTTVLVGAKPIEMKTQFQISFYYLIFKFLSTLLVYELFRVRIDE